MGICITVKDGTNAGCRRFSYEKPKAWRCKCPAETTIAAHWTVCPDCGEKRPK